jgi:hypothetical protein
MSQNEIKRVVSGSVIVLMLSLVAILWGGPKAGALSAPKGESPSNRRSAPQGSGQPVARDARIVELEKKLAGQENKPAEEVFKNIQLFKGQPAMRVLRVMEFGFAPALGVDCTHCHVQDEWGKDDKEAKQTARKMWQFMAKVNQELTQTIGKGTVNCTTCHRGQVKPATSLPGPR